MKYFTSDWHLGHNNIIKLANRPFNDVEEMNDYIIKNMFANLKPGDEIYHLGDLFWNERSLKKVVFSIPKEVNFHIILGNHDNYKLLKKYRNHFSSISDLKEIRLSNKKRVTLCHYPMLTWSQSHRNSWQLYGHIHKGIDIEEAILDRTNQKQLNVNCEFYDYRPVSEDSVREFMNNQPDNWDYKFGVIKNNLK